MKISKGFLYKNPAVYAITDGIYTYTNDTQDTKNEPACKRYDSMVSFSGMVWKNALSVMKIKIVQCHLSVMKKNKTILI